MWYNKVRTIWTQLFPNRAVQRASPATLLQLTPVQFDKAIRPLIAGRESMILLQEMRQKAKLAIYSNIYSKQGRSALGSFTAVLHITFTFLRYYQISN